MGQKRRGITWRNLLGTAVLALTAACSGGDGVTSSEAVLPVGQNPLFAAGTPFNSTGQCMEADVVEAGFISNSDGQCVSQDIDIAIAAVTTYRFDTSNPPDGTPDGDPIPLPAGSQIQCNPGQIVYVVTSAQIQNSAKERYDVGLWIGINGVDARTGIDATGGGTGQCNHYNLIPGQGGAVNLDDPADLCGDVVKNTNVDVALGELAIQCQDDPNIAGQQVTISACSGWLNNDEPGTRDGICPVPGVSPVSDGFRFGTTQGAPPKCKCNSLTLPLDIRGSITIVKNTVGGDGTFAYTGTVGVTSLTTVGGTVSQTIGNLTAGTYTIAETNPSPTFNFTNLVCSDPTTNTTVDLATRSASIVLAAGETVTCTYTNTKTANITVVKACVGGTANFDFTGTVPGGGALGAFDRDCAESGTVVANTTTLGDYTITESAETGWSLTGLSCTGGDADGSTSVATRTATVNLDAGESVTCTFTNTKQASISVTKACVGGTANFDFTGTVPGGGALTPFDRDCAETGVVVPLTTTFGDYTITEAAETGWSLTGLSCTGGDADGSTNLGTRTATVNLDAGEVITCTFTNTLGASITVSKVCVGGTGANFDFTGTVPGGGALGAFDRDCAESAVAVPITSTFGDYTITEAVEAGWSLTGLSCTGGDADGSTSLATRTATVNLDAGESVTCTFTNTKQASISVTKVCVGGTANFDFTGTVPGGGALTPFDRDCDETGVVVPLTSTFGDYTITEATETGWSLTGLSCTGGDADGSTSVATRTATVNLDAGEVITCTFTNTKQASISVTKACVGGTANFDFTGTVPGGGALTPFDRDCAETGVVVPLTTTFGNYTITEALETGWLLTGLSCSGGDADGSISLATRTATVNLDAGEVITCTFTNTKLALAQVIKTVNTLAITGAETFTFTLRSGATSVASGTTLETIVANSTNGGTLNFTTFLTPGNSYQICELVHVGWLSTISGLAGSFVIQPEPDADNSTVCVPFTPTAGQTVTFNIDNTPPPGGDARTIGYWKNHSSCSKSNGNQDPVLDQTLALAPIASGQSTHGIFVGDLYVDTCAEAFAILNKSTLGGKKSASDPAFNMAAQLLAARLNILAGAGASCVGPIITEAQALLDAINFNGSTHLAMTAAQITRANQLAGLLDDYNNNDLVCP